MLRNKNHTQRKKNYLLISTAITALFIAVVLVVNIAFFALANHFIWYIDMTSHQLFTLTDTTKEFISDLGEDVTIYFAVDPDKIGEANENGLLTYPYRTALDMAAESDKINVECIDIVKNPAKFKEFHTVSGQDIYTDSVILATADDFRIYTLESLFVTNEDDGTLWGYQGEYKMVSAILSLTDAEMPPVYFTSSHGESLGDEAAPLKQLFTDAGYEVKEIDLTREDISDDARIVVINDPVYDFVGIEGGEEQENEIAKLDNFLDNLGCLMVFTSPENAGNLTNLSELLSEWGIAFNGDTYVQDKDHAVSTDGKSIVAKYEEDTLGASLYLDLDKNSKTILRNSMPLSILFETESKYEGTREVSAVLSSHDTSVLYKGGEVVGEGSYPIMAISRELTVVDNEYFYSYVFASGSADAVNASYIGSNTYANKDIIFNTIKLTGRERILADIDAKQLDKTSLDITTAEANRWMVILTVTLPVIISIAGVVVHIRRRNA